MLSPYLGVLRLERAWRFSAAGLVLRLPMSMVGISIILLVRSLYGSYALAGAVSAVNIIATACCAPALARPHRPGLCGQRRRRWSPPL